MSKLQNFRLFLNERLTAAAVEIFRAVETTVVGYQEENDRLRNLLFTSDEQCKIDLAFSEEEVPPEQQHCEQEWSPSLGQEDPEPTQIKEEQEELRTSQKEEKLQGLDAEIFQFDFTPCVKRECDQVDPFRYLTFENRDVDWDPKGDPKSFDTLTNQNMANVPCDQDTDNNIDNTLIHSSTISSDQVRRSSRQLSDTNIWLHPVPPLEKPCFSPSPVSRHSYCCRYCGEAFFLKSDLQRHFSPVKNRISECCLCKKHFNYACKLKAHVAVCQGLTSCICPFCGKTFKQKGTLSIHMRIHTGEKPFRCGNCGKSFSQKGHLTMHQLIHTGEKPFSCGECGKSFSLKDNLTRHKLIHTGEKPYSCGDCGKSFNQKGSLKKHKLTHTGEKPFRCVDCGKRFTQKSYLLTHVKNIHSKRTP